MLMLLMLLLLLLPHIVADKLKTITNTMTTTTGQISTLTTESLAAHSKMEEKKLKLAPLKRGFSNVSFEDAALTDDNATDAKHHIKVSGYYDDELEAADHQVNNAQIAVVVYQAHLLELNVN